MPDQTAVTERRHLMALTFRMLGTAAEAEDAVQETYERWYRMPEAEREAVQNRRGWLVTAASRVCLNMLDSARMRRESYPGQWLPEPVPMGAFAVPVADPLDVVEQDETVSTALLLVLETMTPAERVAFVLHDVFALPFAQIAQIVDRTPAACRQLAASARRRVQQSRRRQAPRDEHDAVVAAFGAAARGGDLAALIGVLDPDAVVRSDGGGQVSAARNPVVGAERAARLLLGVMEKNSHVEIWDQQTHDGAGFAFGEDSRVTGVVTLTVGESRIREVRIMMNPDKLGLWGRPS